MLIVLARLPQVRLKFAKVNYPAISKLHVIYNLKNCLLLQKIKYKVLLVFITADAVVY